MFSLGCFCCEFYPLIVFDIDYGGVALLVESHVADDDSCPFVSIDEGVLCDDVVEDVGGFFCGCGVDFLVSEGLVCSLDARGEGVSVAEDVAVFCEGVGNCVGVNLLGVVFHYMPANVLMSFCLSWRKVSTNFSSKCESSGCGYSVFCLVIIVFQQVCQRSEWL